MTSVTTTPSSDTRRPRGTGIVQQLTHGLDPARLRAAAEQLQQHGVTVPLLGHCVKLPPPESVAYYAGLAALAAVEIIEWPLAVVIAAGHELATRSRNPAARGLGESAEAAG